MPHEQRLIVIPFFHRQSTTDNDEVNNFVNRNKSDKIEALNIKQSSFLVAFDLLDQNADLNAKVIYEPVGIVSAEEK